MCHVAPSGEFVRVNKEWADLLGYTVKEITGMSWQDVTHPDDIETDENLVASVLSGDRRTYQLKKRYRHKEGNYFWILLTVCLVRGVGIEDFFISQAISIEKQKELWHD